MTPIIAFDASHLIYRMYYVAKNKLPDHLINGTIYFFFNSVFAVVRRNPGIPILFLNDSAGGTNYRKELNPEYKSNRVTNSDVVEARRRIQEYIDLLNLMQVGVLGFEADDLGYFLSRRVNNSITFISEDVDWISYVIHNKSVIHPIKEESVTFTTLLTKYGPWIDEICGDSDDVVGWLASKGHTLESYVHMLITQRKAILGDGSDHIKGFNKIGPKTAKEIIIKLNKLNDPRDFVGKSVAGKKFQSQIDRFFNNIKVLGYSHIDEHDLSPHFKDFKSSHITDYRPLIEKLANDIDSSRFLKSIESINTSLIKSNVDITFDWVN